MAKRGRISAVAVQGGLQIKRLAVFMKMFTQEKHLSHADTVGNNFQGQESATSMK